MKRLIIQVQIFVLTVACIIVQAQEIKPLKIGDKVPDIVFQKMLFHKAPNGKLSDFKGKAIIIDQWFIGCIPCVSAMPKLDSLQKVYSNDLQILPVTFEKSNNTEMFWAKNITVTGIRLPQVVEDTLVRKYFPAVNFPHQVWINKRGIIEAITDGQQLSKQNIQKLINNEPLALKVKKDEMDGNVRFSTQPTIMIRFEENKNKLLYYSYFSKYRKELNGILRTFVDTSAKLVRVTATNTPLFRLYDFAYANNSWEPRNLSSRFIRNDTKKINGLLINADDTTSQFSYDLMYAGTTAHDFKKYMVPDLDRFFNLKSYEELREVECYVISPNGTGTKYKEFYDPTAKQYHTVDLFKFKKIIANNSYPWLLGAAINDQAEHLVLFELGNAKRVNFEVDWNLQDLQQMNKDFEKFDLKIEKHFKKRKVIILEDQ